MIMQKRSAPPTCAGPLASRELVSLARAANTEFRPGRLRARAGPATWQRDLRALEAQCRVQRQAVLHRADKQFVFLPQPR